MSKTNTSQAQKPSFDPMEIVSKLAADNLARLQALYDELAGWEAKAYDRAKSTADQMSEVATESFNYANKLAAEWRELTLEATRRGAAMFKGS